MAMQDWEMDLVLRQRGQGGVLRLAAAEGSLDRLESP
jgi:hypothetical protein